MDGWTLTLSRAQGGSGKTWRSVRKRTARPPRRGDSASAPAPGLEHAIPEAREGAPQAVAHDGLVIDDENRHRSRAIRNGDGGVRWSGRGQRGSRERFRGDREEQVNGGAAARRALYTHGTALLTHHAMHGREAEPLGLVHRLGAEEGLERSLALLGAHAAAGIADAEPHRGPLEGSREAEPPAGPALHGVA